ncbi:MAG: helix-turn-helix domain-containing protein [Bacteroidia bacterium]
MADVQICMVLKEIGTRIKKIRLSKGLSTDEVGEEIGMLGTSYSKIEREGTNSLKTLFTIASVLEVNIKDLFQEYPNFTEQNEKFGFATKAELEESTRSLQNFMLKEFKKLREELMHEKSKKALTKKGSKKTAKSQ